MTDKYKRMDGQNSPEQRKMDFDKTCLITGCAGFVGRHLARRFSEAGYRVAGIGRGLSPGAAWGVQRYVTAEIDATTAGTALRHFRPAVCVHAAGSASVAESVIDPRGDFERSVPVWRAVLEAAVAEAPDCHVVLASSAAVYDPSLGGAVSEESDCRPGSPYGVHKLECEQLGQEFSRSHGLRVSVARVFNVYGPWMRRQVLWDWCRRAWGSAEGLVRALGSADASRDFIQVSDVAEAILRIAEAPGEGPGVFNVGSGKAVRVGELADLFVEHWPQPVAVAFEQKEAAHSHSSMFADVSRLRRLGFQASVPLADGVREYISWFRGMATKGNPERLAALTPCR